MSDRSVGYERHIFVCLNQRRAGHPRGCCLEKGTAEMIDRFKVLIAKAGLKGRVRANKAGCLDHCEYGPVVVVYPDAVWYGGVTLENLDRIFEEHILGGRPVEELMLRTSTITEDNC